MPRGVRARRKSFEGHSRVGKCAGELAAEEYSGSNPRSLGTEDHSRFSLSDGRVWPGAPLDTLTLGDLEYARYCRPAFTTFYVDSSAVLYELY